MVADFPSPRKWRSAFWPLLLLSLEIGLSLSVGVSAPPTSEEKASSSHGGLLRRATSWNGLVELDASSNASARPVASRGATVGAAGKVEYCEVYPVTNALWPYCGPHAGMIEAGTTCRIVCRENYKPNVKHLKCTLSGLTEPTSFSCDPLFP
eukprot:TRINITY_DN28511_c0_g1_i1.p1 TRINITY_DN28511_c0_g1~~TRINITY_DN28511_c0_g1_i1.p1  ORF type:complete len:152 (-),score=15.29 TRINITY_DN28511_c0_g1_i1:26-481(-)